MWQAGAWYQAAQRVQGAEVGVPLQECEVRARGSRVPDVSDFLESDDFTEAGYLVNLDRRMLVRN